MAKTLFLGLVAAAIPVLSAQAAPATPEEAARLTALFERYVGHPAAGQPSSVAVAPKGESYLVTLDLKRALGGLETFGVSMEPNVSSTTLTPLPDGTWKVTSDASPPVVVHLKEQTITLKAATTTFDGIYDPALYAFRTSTSAYTNYDYAQSSPTVMQDRRIDKLDLALKGAPADGGTVDVSGHYVATGMSADVKMKSPPPPPPAKPGAGNPAVPAPPAFAASFAYTSPSSTIDVAADRFHTKDALDIWAFLVAHPNRDSLIAVQDQFRQIVRAALPMTDTLRESATVDGLAVTTPVGPFSARKLAGGFDLSGLGGAGKAATTLSYEGLTVPPGQLPPWSMDFVPTSLSLALGVDGFHAKEAAVEAVNDYDPKLEKGLTPEQLGKVGRLFWPGTGGTVTLAPSRLTSKLLDLKLEGSASLGSSMSGRVTINGSGLDKAIAALQTAAASDPTAAQMLGPLVLAKNLGKPQADGSLLWVVEGNDAGALTVNGAPLK